MSSRERQIDIKDVVLIQDCTADEQGVEKSSIWSREVTDGWECGVRHPTHIAEYWRKRITVALQVSNSESHMTALSGYQGRQPSSSGSVVCELEGGPPSVYDLLGDPLDCGDCCSFPLHDLS